MEYARLRHLLKHLNNFHCFRLYQYAYRQFHCVETAIHRVYDLLCYKVNLKNSILLLLDLTAAFDTVDHHTFLCDPGNLGITGCALSLFKLIVNDEESEMGVIKYGVS